MNKIYEYGSSLDIYIRAKNPIATGNKNYEQDEVCLVLRDVGVQFNYATNSTDVKGTVPIYKGATDSFPQSVTTSYLPLTSELSSFLFETSEPAYAIQEIEQRTTNGAGKIILRKQPSTTKPIFVYEQGNKVEDWEYDAASNIVRGLAANTTYTLHYFVESDGAVCSLRERFLPYFEVELVGKGNTDKLTSTAHLIIPAAKIDSTPNLIFIDNGQLSVQLTFNIIYKGQDVPHIIFE